mmetsp:Transcript_36916/g.80818  ORF Transcript_36916/g.80818 Transcript_36916/m.80818 type:complete len:81 (+) Transcript_36916:737-979(+)
MVLYLVPEIGEPGQPKAKPALHGRLYRKLLLVQRQRRALEEKEGQNAHAMPRHHGMKRKNLLCPKHYQTEHGPEGGIAAA